ncbi:MAG: type 1 glutamine amidotransferase family protein [Solirubrobacterales bacterium]
MNQEIVHVFVFDTLSDWEPCYAVAGINNPMFQLQPGRYAVKTVGVSTRPVKTMGGITVVPDMTLDALDPRDSVMLILPGGITWDQGKNAEAIEKARAFLDAGVPVAAICGATGALARGGLLDARRHTSNALEYLAGTGYRGAALYQDEPAVTDRLVITAGGLAPVDFAYHIFKMLNVFSEPTLEAWRLLFKTGDPAHYLSLMKSSSHVS